MRMTSRVAGGLFLAIGVAMIYLAAAELRGANALRQRLRTDGGTERRVELAYRVTALVSSIIGMLFVVAGLRALGF